MDEIIKIDAKEAGNKLAVFKHYYLEILLIVFAFAIVFINKQQREDRVESDRKNEILSQKLEKYIVEDKKILIEKLSEYIIKTEENTAVMKEVIFLLKELKELKK